MKIRAIVEKELEEVRRDRILFWSLVLPPIIFVIMPLGMLYFMGRDPGSVNPRDVEMYLRLSPLFAHRQPVEILQYILLQQFMFFFLMIPLILPMYIASSTIVGEKVQRSLEPLLATPVEVWELLLGKSLAAALPAIAITWVVFTVFLAGVRILASGFVFQAVASPMWFLAMGIIAPLLTVLAVNLAVIISSRVNDVRAAQQIGGLVVIPLAVVAILQTAGMILFSLQTFVLATVIIAALDVLVLYVGVKLFQRETILTRWK